MSKKKEKEKGFQIQDFIKNNNFGFFICLCAVIFQALHTQYNLKRLSSLTNVFGFNLSEYHAVGIASIISMAILYFTLRKRRNQAIGWACFEAYMNICYYAIYISTTPVDDNYLYWIAIPSALALPAILASFANELLYDEEGIISFEYTEQIDQLKLFFSTQFDALNKRITDIANMNETEKDTIKDSIRDIKESLESFKNSELTLENLDTGTTARVKMKE